MQLGDEISNGTFKVNVKAFSHLLVLMLISYNSLAVSSPAVSAALDRARCAPSREQRSTECPASGNWQLSCL